MVYIILQIAPIVFSLHGRSELACSNICLRMTRPWLRKGNMACDDF